MVEEEVDKVEDKLVASARRRDPNDKSLRKSFEESEVDGLIKWAKDLPDDLASHSQMSFFKQLSNNN